MLAFVCITNSPYRRGIAALQASPKPRSIPKPLAIHVPY
jgi:hypothetical protein